MPKANAPSASEIAEKWASVTPGRASYYEAGVTNPGEDWEKNAAAQASSYKAAVQSADIDKRFSGGVHRAGTAKWQRKAKDVGVSRFGTGVSAAKADMGAGVEPYVAVINATELSARKPRGDAGNLDRVKQIATALHTKRLALIGAGGTK